MCEKCRNNSSSEEARRAHKRARRSSGVIDESEPDHDSDDTSRGVRRESKLKRRTVSRKPEAEAMAEPTPKTLREYGLFRSTTRLRWVKAQGQFVNATVLGDRIADAASPQTFATVSEWCNKAGSSSDKRAWETVLVFDGSPTDSSEAPPQTMSELTSQLETLKKQCQRMVQLMKNTCVEAGSEAILMKRNGREQTVDLLPNGMLRLGDDMCVGSAQLFTCRSRIEEHAAQLACSNAGAQQNLA